mmetsp:Transcript_24510/g.30806  ORF Transcript_24510/g.30806 Transcript_24510/m.30806 type:complete len:88 (+) Transcript_24510:496-759(+)
MFNDVVADADADADLVAIFAVGHDLDRCVNVNEFVKLAMVMYRCRYTHRTRHVMFDRADGLLYTRGIIKSSSVHDVSGVAYDATCNG